MQSAANVRSPPNRDVEALAASGPNPTFAQRPVNKPFEPIHDVQDGWLAALEFMTFLAIRLI